MVISKQGARTLSTVLYLNRLAIKILQLVVTKCYLLGHRCKGGIKSIHQFKSRLLTVEKFTEAFFQMDLP